MTARLHSYRISVITQVRHDRQYSRLFKGLTTGEFHKPTASSLNKFKNFLHRHPLVLLSVVKRIRRIAPSASKTASLQSNEKTRHSGSRPLSLNGVEHLVDVDGI
jgi:hypothetical protein